MIEHVAPERTAPTTLRCEHCGDVPASADGVELRCGCGCLLGRFVSGGLELKCRRCKRVIVLPVER